MKSQFATIAGGRLHYVEWVSEQPSEALPVVCLHGNLSNALTFRWIGEALSAGAWGGPPRSVLALDKRGCGDSDSPENGYAVEDFARDVEAVLQDAGVERAVFLAFSMGVATALQFMLDHPGRVAGLVIGDYPARYPRLSEDWVERTRSSFARTFDSWDSLFATVSPNGEMTREEFDAECHDHFRERDGRIGPRFDQAVIPLLQADSAFKDLSAALSGWNGPLLILRGSEQGSLLSDEAVQVYVQLRPDASVVRIQGVGHEVFARQTDVVEALKAFLD